MTEYIIQAREKCDDCDGVGQCTSPTSVTEGGNFHSYDCLICTGTGHTYRDIPLVEVLAKVVWQGRQWDENIFETGSMPNVRIEE